MKRALRREGEVGGSVFGEEVSGSGEEEVEGRSTKVNDVAHRSNATAMIGMVKRRMRRRPMRSMRGRRRRL